MIGVRIKELREENHMTQTELGLSLGVGKTTISNYETGYSSPDHISLVKLAETFNVSTDYILGLTPLRNSYKNSFDSLSISSAEQNLVDNYRQLNSEGINYIDHQMQLALQLYKKCNKPDAVEDQPEAK